MKALCHTNKSASDKQKTYVLSKIITLLDTVSEQKNTTNRCFQGKVSTSVTIHATSTSLEQK